MSIELCLEGAETLTNYDRPSVIKLIVQSELLLVIWENRLVTYGVQKSLRSKT